MGEANIIVSQLPLGGIAQASLRLCKSLGDEEVTLRLKRLVRIEKGVAAVVVAHLAEFDSRELFVKTGFPSLFLYCVKELGLSEAAAYKRIQAARAVRRAPVVLDWLAQGRVHLSAVAVLAPHIEPASAEDLLRRAEGATKRELEGIVVGLLPRPDKPDVVRRLPDLSAAPHASELPVPAAEPPSLAPEMEALRPEPSSTAAVSRQRMEALSPGRVHFSFTGSEQLRGKLDRVHELLWHVEPAGKLEVLIERLADFYLARKDPGRDKPRRRVAPVPAACAAAASAKRTRRIPQAVKDAVWARDGGRCVYVAPDGRRCAETAGLEYDHVVPWALGGPSDAPENVRLLCPTHNRWEAKELGLSPPS